MKLWTVRRKDAVDYEEYSTVLVRAETEEDALYFVCGGPDKEFPELRVMDHPPLHGFLADGSNAVVEELLTDGVPGFLMGEGRGA